MSVSLKEARTASDQASWREFSSRDAALKLYFRSMALAWEIISSVPPRDSARIESELAEARTIYNRDLDRFLRLAGGHQFRLDDAWQEDLARRGISVEIRRTGDVWDPGRFDGIRLAGDYVIVGIDQYHGADGVGVPVIAEHRPSPHELAERQGQTRFFPFWEVYPATAVLRFERAGPGSSIAVLELVDTLRHDRLSIDGREQVLAADLTTPTAYHFARSRLKWYEQISMFTPEKLHRKAGLYILHPYEPGKIPLVMVHGLWSSPMAWARVVNELRGDPVIRSRYQFWAYMYPTGNSFLLSAANFRTALEELRQTVDPKRQDHAFDQMVLVGHSMGGLICRLMIAESSDQIWRVYSQQPFSRLSASTQDRAMLERAMFFHANPSVRRVVFIATPHRGARMGSNLVGRIGDRLIRLPSPLKKSYDAMLARNGPDFFTDAFREGPPSSIDELELDNPLLRALSQLPIASGVVCHSVIGKLGPGPLKSSTDGLVPYSSSHINWAASELVVPKLHECQDDPRTIQELRRILLLHAQ
ncbi:MAG: esterase/lipase family protein [Isosphaeraceae bacterium]